MIDNRFVYTLKLRPDLLEEENWTQREEEIVEAHFLRLQHDTSQEKLF